MENKLKKDVSSVNIGSSVFDASYNEALIHQVVVGFLSGGRSGTKSQKTRSEVSGGGIKPWRQKGTGRARAGSIRSPIWRSGGVAFAAKPRDHDKKVNRKMYRAAMSSIIAELYRQGRLIVVDNFEITDGKTKSFIKLVKDLDLGDDVLLVTESGNNDLYRAANNVPLVNIVDVRSLNPVILLQHKKVAVDQKAIEKINEWLS